MNYQKRLFNVLLENGQSDYHSKVKGLISAIKDAKGTPEADTLRTQLDQTMKAHYQGMGRREFSEFGASLISPGREGQGKKR